MASLFLFLPNFLSADTVETGSLPPVKNGQTIVQPLSVTYENNNTVIKLSDSIIILENFSGIYGVDFDILEKEIKVSTGFQSRIAASRPARIHTSTSVRFVNGVSVPTRYYVTDYASYWLGGKVRIGVYGGTIPMTSTSVDNYNAVTVYYSGNIPYLRDY